MTSKQRAYLRSMANTMETILYIGKDGIGENLVKQANDALEAREIIKGRVLENSMLTAREACQELCVLTRSEPVQVIGTKFVLYRTSHSMPREKRIQLVTAGQKKTVKTVVSKPAQKTENKTKSGAKPGAKTGKTGAKFGAGKTARTAVRKGGKK